MLTIYTCIGRAEHELEKAKIPVKHRNDAWFDANFRQSKIVMDAVVKRIIMQIDGSKVVDNRTIITRFGEARTLDYLSTGCKTAINVYMFPDICFNAIECSSNSLQEILRLNRGYVIMPLRPLIEDDFDIDALLINNEGKAKVVKKFTELESLLD